MRTPRTQSRSDLDRVTQQISTEAQTGAQVSFLCPQHFLVTFLPLPSLSGPLQEAIVQAQNAFSVFHLSIHSKQDQPAIWGYIFPTTPATFPNCFCKPRIPAASQNHHQSRSPYGSWKRRWLQVMWFTCCWRRLQLPPPTETQPKLKPRELKTVQMPLSLPVLLSDEQASLILAEKTLRMWETEGTLRSSCLVVCSSH